MRSAVALVLVVIVCGVSAFQPKNFRIQPPSTDGEGLVPLPQKVQFGTTVYSLDPAVFQLFVHTSPLCDVLDSTAKRYLKILFQSGGEGKVKKFYDGETSSVAYRWLPVRQTDVEGLDNSTSLKSLQVVISGKCEKYPYLGMNENYTLGFVDLNSAVLKSDAIWGAIRGLETFSQLAFYSPADSQKLYVKSADITDFPRFPFRGFMLDTSRHFLRKKYILQNLDLAAQAKFNVFHWHIVDDQSFPYQSVLFPNVTAKGAFSPRHIYSQADVAEIIEYARVRGIRVIPEFDTPGHSLSWGAGQKGLLTPCYDPKGKPTGDFGPIDPSNAANFDFLFALFKEIMAVFPDVSIHLGGDEVDPTCWLNNPSIQRWMAENNFKTGPQVEDFYVKTLLWLLPHARQTKVDFLVWQEVFDDKVQISRDTIVNVWKDGWYPELANVTKAGYKAVLSACWYLNYLHYGIDWHDFYTCDPHNFNGTDEQKKLVLGGSTTMWGEYIDDTNVINNFWPRAAVVAERLWSSQLLKDPKLAAPRLTTHRCRSLRRGYQVESINGPGFCPIEWD